MKFSLSEIKKIVELNEQNYSQAEIGEKFSVSGQYIGKILRWAGKETNRGGWKEKQSVIDAKHQRVTELFDSGYSIKEIAKKESLSWSGVYYILRKFDRIAK